MVRLAALVEAPSGLPSGAWKLTPSLAHAAGAASKMRAAKATLSMFWLRGSALICNELRNRLLWGRKAPD